MGCITAQTGGVVVNKALRIFPLLLSDSPITHHSFSFVSEAEKHNGKSTAARVSVSRVRLSSVDHHRQSEYENVRCLSTFSITSANQMVSPHDEAAVTGCVNELVGTRRA